MIISYDNCVYHIPVPIQNAWGLGLSLRDAIIQMQMEIISLAYAGSR